MSQLPHAHDSALDAFAPVIREALWPAALLTAGGLIVAFSEPAAALLGATAPARGRALETFLIQEDRVYLRLLLGQVAAGGAPVLARVQLGGAAPRQVEIELHPVPDAGPPCISAVFYPESQSSRREQLFLECSMLVPRLLRARSIEEVYEQVAAMMRPLGFGVTALLPGQGSLRVAYKTPIGPPDGSLTRLLGGPPLGEQIPDAAPIISEAIERRGAVYHPDLLPLSAALRAPDDLARIRIIQQLIGLRGYVVAPLIVDDGVRGVLAVWGQILVPRDVPYIEAFAHQIAGALTQIDLRHRTEARIRQLNSLATTARAVTNLGALEDVLRVICVQAHRMLDAEYAGVAMRSEDGRALTVTVGSGRWDESLRGVSYPVDGSLAGTALRSERGLIFADIHAEPGAHWPTMLRHGMRSAMFYPLRHQGAVFGIISCGHSQAAHFRQADLEVLARYAEFAAIAVANTQLHATLRRTAAEKDALYREAEATRRYLDAIIQNAPDLMLVCRPDTSITPLNAGPLRFVGYQPEEVHGVSFLRFLPPEYHAELSERWAAALTGKPQRFEMELYRADGTRFSALISADLIQGYDEVLVIAKDITELRALETQIRQSEKLSALSRLVAGAAHELNNPLAVILGLAQLQLLEDLPDSTRADIANIERAALRAGAIVQQLRMFARPQQLKVQPVDIAAVARDTLARLSAPIASSEIVTERSFAGEPLYVAGEPHQIEQVLFNIIQNAVQALAANPPGAIRRLAVAAWPEHDHVRISVTDSGPGIPREHLPQIFEPFFTTRDVGQGLGLGLTIAHAIVQQHGGEVWATTHPGGTTFDLRLPAALPPTPVAEPALPPGSRILIVEDEAQVRAVAERVLTRHECFVDAVSSGEEALARASDGSYTLVISDLQMPGMDGPTLYERLHALRPDLRWLILTGDTMGEPSRIFLERTALPVLAKPFTQEQLVRSVAENLTS